MSGVVRTPETAARSFCSAWSRPARAVEGPAQGGQDLVRARELCGVDLGELQSPLPLGRIVLLDQGEREPVGDRRIGGGFAVQRFEDLFGGGEVAEMPGDQPAQPSGIPSRPGRV